MHDTRYYDLARLLVGHSTQIQSGEKVLIEAFDIPDDMVIALIRTIREASGVPLVTVKHQRLMRELAAVEGLDDEQATERLDNVLNPPE